MLVKQSYIYIPALYILIDLIKFIASIDASIDGFYGQLGDDPTRSCSGPKVSIAAVASAITPPGDVGPQNC
jgi:hypothetical protein